MSVTAMKHDASKTAARVSALADAEASCVREGLPPMSEDARAMAMRYARGELTADEAVAQIVSDQKKALGR